MSSVCSSWGLASHRAPAEWPFPVLLDVQRCFEDSRMEAIKRRMLVPDLLQRLANVKGSTSAGQQPESEPVTQVLLRRAGRRKRAGLSLGNLPEDGPKVRNRR